MALGTLSIDLSARVATLEKDLARVGRMVDQQTNRMASSWDKVADSATSIVGAVSLGAAAAWARSLVDGVDALNDAADATGSTVEAMSALEDVAKRNGHTLQGYTDIIAKLQNALRQADGTNAQAQAFKALGLSLEDLRKADPAEMALAVAQALDRFADGGSKARLQQVLLGESAGKAAPLLKDLAEQGALVAKVTTEQANEAERFNKALAGLQADAQSAGRSIMLDMLPSLRELMRELSAGRKAFGSWGDAILSLGTENYDYSPLQHLQGYEKQLAQVEATMARIDAGSERRSSIYGVDRMPNLKAQAENLRHHVAYYREIVGLTSQAGAGRGVVNPALTKPDLPEIRQPGPKIEQGAIKDAQAYYKALFLASEKAAYGLPDNAGGFMGPEVDAQTLADRAREATLAEQALAATAAGRLTELNAMRAAVNAALAEGADPTQAAQALELIDGEIKRITTSTNDLGEMMRNSLGDGLRMALQGNFEGIAQMFQNIVLEKIARDAEKLLMQLWDSAGGLGGVMGGLGGLLGGLFGAVPKFAAGGDHGGGWRLVGEQGPELQATGPARIFNAAQTRQILSGSAAAGGAAAPVIQLGGNTYHVGAGVSIAQVQAVVQASERRQTAQLARWKTEGRLG